MIEPKLISPPTTFPATLDQVKQHLRVSDPDEDALLTEVLMPAALGCIEGRIRRAVMPQTWEIALDVFPAHEIRLPVAPVHSIVSVVYVDADGADQTLGTDQYAVDTYSWPGWLLPTSAWPSTADTFNAVRVRWVAAGDCPAAITQAFLLLVGHFYRSREAVGEAMAEIPLGVAALLSPHKVHLTVA